MALPQYSPERRRELAKQLRVEEQYLYQVMRRLKVASPSLARQLHSLDSNAALHDLRPDDWHLIWPELTGAGGAPVIELAKAEA